MTNQHEHTNYTNTEKAVKPSKIGMFLDVAVVLAFIALILSAIFWAVAVVHHELAREQYDLGASHHEFVERDYAGE